MQRTEGVSFLHPCVAVRSKRQAVEEKDEEKRAKKAREQGNEKGRDSERRGYVDNRGT